MANLDEQATQDLFDKNLITENQYQEIKAYRSLGIFSLNAELKLFLYFSALLFTSGIGILIYDNIDSFGHIVLLSVLLILIGGCFYYCFKNSKGFQKTETVFESPFLEYIVLIANVLTCIFIGYLQFQYEAFGTHYGLATLIPTIVSFSCAYYFDNKSVLTIAVTGLAAYIGLSVTPQDIFNSSNDFYDNQTLTYSAIALGVLLIVWTIYSSRINLKTHFTLVYLTFALHLISVATISNLFTDDLMWLLFTVVLGISSFYFYKVSHEQKAISLYIFMIVYAYIGFNVFVIRLFEYIYIPDIFVLTIVFMPFYLIGSIVMFIKLIKKFNKEVA